MPDAGPLDEVGVPLAHRPEAARRVRVQIVMKLPLEQRQELADKDRPPRHPLIVGTPAVVIWTVESRARKAGQEPAKERFMADVHSESYLRLLAIAAERALANQQPHDQAPLEIT